MTLISTCKMGKGKEGTQGYSSMLWKIELLKLVLFCRCTIYKGQEPNNHR